MSNIHHTTRREFLRRASVAIAAPYVITTTALGSAERPPASERIVMGGIGIGRQGGGDQRNFLGRGQVQYVAVCDVKQSARDRARDQVNKRYENKDCAVYKDFRELLSRKDIDAVHIGTPDHWHAIVAIAACRNGKDVYCEKPESLTIREGRAMVQAARRYGCVVSGGSQRVLDDTGKLALRCWNGEFGALKEAYVTCGPPSTPCNLPSLPDNPDVDWDMWLGPAPWSPYHPYRIGDSYSIDGTSWRSWRDYSGGGMTDWGAHRFGGAMFICDIREQGPVEVIPPDGKEHKFLTYRFANGLRMYHCPTAKDIEVPGSTSDHGVSVLGKAEEQMAAKPMPGYKGSGGIFGDFLHCVRSREKPFRDIELAHRTATVCHLGVIAYDLNRPLKWDPDKEEFPGDAEANRFLDRAKREPWQL